MDHIDETLTTQSQDMSIAPSIRGALSLAKKTLNKYYNKTDDSEVYRIAMSEFIILVYWLTLSIPSSPTPSTQTQVFRVGWMESGLDYRS
jgi:hypothetical protein